MSFTNFKYQLSLTNKQTEQHAMYVLYVKQSLHQELACCKEVGGMFVCARLCVWEWVIQDTTKYFFL